MATPTDLAPLLLDSVGDVPGPPVGLQRILIGACALEELVAEVRAVARPGRIVVFEDTTPMRRGEEDLKRLVATMLAELGDVQRIVLGGPDGALHADARTIAVAREAAVGAGCVVTVGSGTLTDIGKEAVNRDGGAALVAVQTAASVNGFADDMAVVLKDGVKRTIPSVWPSALIIDTQVLAAAPEEMTRSGLAEMMAMFTAPADWRLAAAAGFDPSYDHRLVRLFRERGEELLAAASQLSTKDGEALDLLATLLTASGMAMGIAGRTAPLSGTEHLISHLLDMSAESAGTRVGRHGAQVGVGAVIAACLWERVLDRVNADQILSDSSIPSPESARSTVEDAFASLDPSGAMGAECWSDYSAKLETWRHGDRAALAAGWPQLVSELRSLVGDPSRMAAALAAADAPVRFSQLDPAVDGERARWALSSCHLMRNRFTVADLAFLTGNLNDGDIDAVLDRAAEIGGGL